MSTGAIARGLGAIAALALVTILIRGAGLDGGLDALTAWIDAEVRGRGLMGSLMFVAAGTLITGAGLSRQAVAYVAGYAFGVAIGSGLTVLATVAGCALAFSYGRFFGRAFVMKRYSRRLAKIDRFLCTRPFLMTLAVRLLPIGNNLVVNLVAGVSGVPAPAFLSASALGYVPQTVVFALMGSGLAEGIMAGGIMINTAVAIALFLVSASIGVYLCRQYRREQALDDAVDVLRMSE
ncbi:MAG: VTT domain-containing protein [Rhodospirillales bacterium]|nr:VTT domain-containing protein [Rhodospirillales bacterium]